jgi:hypothetical protein
LVPALPAAAGDVVEGGGGDLGDAGDVVEQRGET